ncbi:MAG TPA: HNH endonuclease [Sphingomicrobium sp.]|nr:HNH endonuclease [Sphingomicrobium sp.]
MTDPVGPICWLCSRPLGTRVEWHHPVPKSRGGREKQPIHPICHRNLHARFSNAELQRIGDDPSRLRLDPDIARFLDWIGGKDPDFHAPTFSRR